MDANEVVLESGFKSRIRGVLGRPQRRYLSVSSVVMNVPEFTPKQARSLAEVLLAESGGTMPVGLEKLTTTSFDIDTIHGPVSVSAFDGGWYDGPDVAVSAQARGSWRKGQGPEQRMWKAVEHVTATIRRELVY